jgi:outer membrane immunogenic protein
MLSLSNSFALAFELSMASSAGKSVMNRVLPSVLALLFATSAFGAGLAPAPAKPVEPAADQFSWTGFYGGVNAGYGWTSSGIGTTGTNTFATPGLNGNIGGAVASRATVNDKTDGRDFSGGLQIGYNYQFPSRLVAGVETDFDGGGAKFTSSSQSLGTVPGAASPISSNSLATWSTRLNYLGTLRGRLGYLPTSQLLVFATGGLAYGGISSHANISETLGFSDVPGSFGTSGGVNVMRTGWTAGGGAEWAFLAHWSAKIEYLYYDLGKVGYNLPTFNQYGGFGTVLETTTAVRASAHTVGDVVRVGLNYHFD